MDSEAVNKGSSNLSADELLELLNTDKTMGEKSQSGVVTDKVLKYSGLPAVTEQKHIQGIRHEQTLTQTSKTRDNVPSCLL